VLLTACGRQPPPEPGPRAVDIGPMTADQLRQAVLQECHGVLQGGMDRVAVDVTLGDGSMVQAFAHLPDRLRVQTGTTPPMVLAGDDAFELDGERSVVLPDAPAARMRALRALLDAATLGPLYRAETATRTDDVLEVKAGGRDFALHLRPGTLLPERLDGPAGQVHFRSHRGTGTTWIAERVALDGIGECSLHFRLSGLDWEPDFFARPEAAAPPDTARRPVSLPGASPEARPRVPEPDENRAMSWVVLDDPGTWPERAAAYRSHHEVLMAHDQQIAGFAAFLREGDRAVMAIPFRQRKGGAALPAPPGWVIRALPAQPVLVVFPDGGSIEDRIARGEELLLGALRARGIAAAGPVVAQPYLHLQEGTPAPDKLAAAAVRVTVAVR
jgi:hypothetical protein